MKKTKKGFAIILVGSVILGLIATPCSAAIHTNVVINVNPKVVLNEVSPNLFGVNHRYFDDGVGTYDPVAKKIYPEFLAAYNDVGFKSLRYPGGTVGNTFAWKRAIGPQDQRGKMVHSHIFNRSPQTANFGLDEAARFCEDTNTDMEYVYSMGNGNAQDCADLVEYLNAPNDGSNINGGTDWAKIRADNGHPEPYNVKTIEIGNEMYIPGQYYWLYNNTSLSFEQNYIFGGNMRFVNNPVVLSDDWRASAAESDGTANQVKYVRYDNVVPGSVSVYVDMVNEWTLVNDLQKYGENDTVYTVNHEKGQIVFGDGVHGKIPRNGALITASYTSSRDGYVDYYKSIKEVDPSVRVYSCYSSQKFIEIMGSEHNYDGLAMHPYAQFMPPTISVNDYHDNIMVEADEQLGHMEKVIANARNTVSPQRRDAVNLMATEYGILSDNAPEKNYLCSLDHGLFVSKYLMRFMDMNLEKAHKHCLIDVSKGDVLGPGGQAVISGNPDYVESATAYAIKMFIEMTGNKVVTSSITNCPTRKIHNGKLLDKINVVSTTDDSGNTYLMVVNVDHSDAVTTSINLEEFTPKGNAEVWTLNSESYLDYNDAENRNKVTVQKTAMQVGNSFDYTFPAHSLTAFKIAGKTNSEVVPLPNPVAAWNFNQQNNGIVSDSTGTGHDMELKNGAVLVEKAHGDSMLQLTSTNDYAAVPFVVDLHETDMSASVWVRLDNIKDAKQIILQQGGTYGTTWLYRRADGRIASYIGGNETAGGQRIESNRWYHVAVVKEGNTVKIYLNGKITGYGTSVVDHISTAKMLFGQHKIPTVIEQDWDGAIDQAAIYNVPLSDAQIQQIYNTEKLP